MIETEEFRKATGGSINDIRMSAQETALRFIYFYNQYSASNPIGDYNGNMSASLDVCVDTLNNYSAEKLSSYIEIYRKSMQMAFDLFGKYTFRRVDLETIKKPFVNKSLMLTISVLLAHHYKVYNGQIVDGKTLVEELRNLLKQNREFVKAITASTTSRANLNYTFATLKKELFDKYLLK